LFAAVFCVLVVWGQGGGQLVFGGGVALFCFVFWCTLSKKAFRR
jgi:hypothetical protein